MGLEGSEKRLEEIEAELPHFMRETASAKAHREYDLAVSTHA